MSKCYRNVDVGFEPEEFALFDKLCVEKGISFTKLITTTMLSLLLGPQQKSTSSPVKEVLKEVPSVYATEGFPGGCGSTVHNCRKHPNYTKVFGNQLFPMKSLSNKDISTGIDGRLVHPEAIIGYSLKKNLTNEQIVDVLSNCDSTEYQSYIDDVYLEESSGARSITTANGTTVKYR
jgi:hypothetical protein